MTPRVWAPGASRVTLHHGPDLSAEAEMRPVADRTGESDRSHRSDGADGSTDSGWWEAELALPVGTEYAFALDGAPPRPDPRSLFQPRGPHGASAVVDLGSFTWTDQAWAGRDVRGAVTYELHVGTFTATGTLDSAIERLPHLAELGVDLVELMPVADAPGTRGWGYDGVNLFAVHHAYGGPHALQRFVDAAHGLGLGVVLDVVYNHLGPSGNYLEGFGPYFTDAHETPWGRAVNLDQEGSTQVRRWICDNALMWLRDFHIDALRLDAVHALVDDSPEHLLTQLARETAGLADELGRPLGLVAESDLNDVTMITPTSGGGLGMTAQWADDVHHAIHAWLTGERQGYYVDFGSTAALRKVLTNGFFHDGSFSTFRGRPWGKPVPREIDGNRFVVSTSNPDQVGNRALGDRPSARLSQGELAISAAILLTCPFSPMLFMGEEWGANTDWRFFTDHSEPELAAAISAGRAREFGGHGWTELYGHTFEVPDPQDPATRDASVLNWSELADDEHNRLFAWNRELIALRRANADLASGDLTATSVVVHPTAEACERMPLIIGRGSFAVLVNPTEEPVGFAIPSHYRVVASWEPAHVGLGEVTVQGPGVTIIGPDQSPEDASNPRPS